MDNFEFVLFDRIEKIKNTILNPNEWYIAFSGGSDSMVLHHLIDLALPDNHIPRIFHNTGIEEKETLKFVRSLAEKDNRFKIINVNKHIPSILSKGYPFKSKKYSMYYEEFSKGLPSTNFLDSYNLLFKQFNRLTFYLKKNNYNIGFHCCKELKKDFDYGFKKTITGIRKAEGGLRADYGKCYSEYNGFVKFNPLFVIDDLWKNEFIKRYNIKLSPLYYPPFNFTRSGCVGCPYKPDLKEYLLIMKKYDYPTFVRCWYLWGYVYKAYIDLNYRLDKSVLL